DATDADVHQRLDIEGDVYGGVVGGPALDGDAPVVGGDRVGRVADAQLVGLVDADRLGAVEAGGEHERQMVGAHVGGPLDGSDALDAPAGQRDERAPQPLAVVRELVDDRALVRVE